MKLRIAYQKNSLNYDPEYNDIILLEGTLDLKGAIIQGNNLIIILQRREAKKIMEQFHHEPDIRHKK